MRQTDNINCITNHPSQEAFLASLPLFSKYNKEDIKSLLEGHTCERYPKGYLLFINGEEAERYYIIRSGWVKLFRETLDGAQAIIDILPERHIFGETALFEDNIYPYSAEIAEESEILSLPLSKLRKFIETRGDFALSMLTSMARYRRQQDKEIEHRTLQNAPQRIGCFLLRLTPEASENNAPFTIHLPYDKTLIAARLGMQPETFSRALLKLKEQTGLKVAGSSIQVNDLNALVKYACSACTTTFPCQDLDCSSCEG